MQNIPESWLRPRVSRVSMFRSYHCLHFTVSLHSPGVCLEIVSLVTQPPMSLCGHLLTTGGSHVRVSPVITVLATDNPSVSLLSLTGYSSECDPTDREDFSCRNQNKGSNLKWINKHVCKIFQQLKLLLFFVCWLRECQLIIMFRWLAWLKYYFEWIKALVSFNVSIFCRGLAIRQTCVRHGNLLSKVWCVAVTPGPREISITREAVQTEFHIYYYFLR